MSYGIELRSTLDGSVVVDEEFPTLVLDSRIVSAATGGVHLLVQEKTTPEPPIVFVNADSNAAVTITGIEYNPWEGVWRFTFLTDRNCNVTFYTFRPVNLMGPSTADYGMRIHTSSGNLVFDSGRKHQMFLKKFVASQTWANNGTLSAPGISKPAVSYHVPAYINNSGVLYARGYVTDNGLITFKPVYADSVAPRGDGGNSQPMAIIDGAYYD